MDIGRILNNRYEIVMFIGSGGMANVYLGQDRVLNRNVAIKILKPEFAGDEQFLKKFEREAQADAKLSHLHIVSVHDTGSEGNIHYIIMEYVDGNTLKDYINYKGKLSYRESINYTLAIASALNHAHKNNIIHRDVKPQNILLTKEKKMPKVADFGIARAITSATVTVSEEAMGSVHYVSPEQARGGFLDERSDLYSLGIVMFEMITGKLPFDADSPISVALMHIQKDMPLLSEYDEDVPKSLETIVKNLTNKAPRARYQNAGALIEDLKKVRENINAPIRDLETGEEQIIEEDKIIENENNNVKNNKKMKGKMPAKDKKGKKKLPIWMIIAIAVGAIALIVLGYFGFKALTAKEVTIPDVANLTLEQVEDKLKPLGLSYTIESRENSLTVPLDSVISQDPKPGTKMKNNKKLKIVVSDGPKEIEMIDLTGLTEIEATNKLLNAGLVLGQVIKEPQPDYEKNKVFKQDPIAGSKVKEGSSVNIYISTGDESVNMVSLIGKSLSEAKSTITSLGLKLGDVTYSPSDTYDEGYVTSQNPATFASVKKNDRVNLVVSAGRLSSRAETIRLSDFTSGGGSNVSVRIDLKWPDGTTRTSYQNSSIRDDQTFNVSFRGYGNCTYTVYINGSSQGSRNISF